ncbi:hypothetical protein RHGRI_015564 [Rhododendron griersonianum]|uniref:Uncharacterized protein n=1 Tax=Rhododendron griersonianum TaxID=479676 RepID=A0AAV6KEB1_9ERIC|nr:hypothetical protein RHGRI_015564 [Rhododendron griersonianum]
MERWKGWIWFYFKISFFLPTKAILVKVASCHKDKAEGSKHHNLGIHFFALGLFGATSACTSFITSHNQATTNTQFSILLKILYCNEIMQCNVEDLFSLPLSVSLTMLMAEKRRGLVSLYKDMEDCEGYEDIHVMWEIIHSSCPPNSNDNRSSKRPGHWRFCFRPT